MKLRDLWPMAVTFPLLFLPLIDWSLEQQVPQKMTEVDGRVVDVHEYPCHHDDDSAADARRCYELSVAYAGDLAAQLTFNYRQTRYGEVHVGDHLPVLVPTAQA